MDGRRPVGGSAGFTLMEILIAMLILAVGLLGVLSLFPAGLKSDMASAEDTYSGLLCESVEEALRAAVQNPDLVTSQLTFIHDLDDGTNRGSYQFMLPAAPGTKERHPQDPSRVFKLGTDAGIKLELDSAKQNDPTDPYGSFGFTFDVENLGNDLYEFKITIFRRTAGMQPGPDVVDWSGVQYRKLNIFRVRLRGRK